MIDYKDIPKFYKSNYHVNTLGFKGLIYTMKCYQDEYNLELNPDFQRGHVWNDNQKSAFILYILKGGLTGRELYFNCPGWDVPGTDEGQMVCVDGLQRITAVQQFMANEIPVTINGNKYYCKDINNMRISSLTFSIHINCLMTRAEEIEWYLQFNTGGTVHSEEEINRVKDLLKKYKK